jgi:hypothetical protein
MLSLPKGIINVVIIITISLPPLPPLPLPPPPSCPQSLIKKPGLLFIQTTRLFPSAGFGCSHYCPINLDWITKKCLASYDIQTFPTASTNLYLENNA